MRSSALSAGSLPSSNRLAEATSAGGLPAFISPASAVSVGGLPAFIRPASAASAGGLPAAPDRARHARHGRWPVAPIMKAVLRLVSGRPSGRPWWDSPRATRPPTRRADLVAHESQAGHRMTQHVTPGVGDSIRCVEEPEMVPPLPDGIAFASGQGIDAASGCCLDPADNARNR